MIAAQLSTKAEKALYLGLASIPNLEDQECLFLQETAATSIQLDSRLDEVVDEKHLYRVAGTSNAGRR